MRGFTLIESLVYIALFGIIISTAFIGTESLGSSADRVVSQSLLQEEGDFLSTKIALAYSTASSSTLTTSSAITISNLSHTSSTYYLLYVFTLSTLTNEGQKISKDFSVVIPTFP